MFKDNVWGEFVGIMTAENMDDEIEIDKVKWWWKAQAYRVLYGRWNTVKQWSSEQKHSNKKNLVKVKIYKSFDGGFGILVEKTFHLLEKCLTLNLGK